MAAIGKERNGRMLVGAQTNQVAKWRDRGGMATARTRILTVMLVTSVALNVALAHKLRQLNGLFRTTSAPALGPGTVVPAFEAVDLRGNVERISYSEISKPTVLYIFTPPCSWCARNMDSFKTLVTRESGEYRFVGLSLSKEGLPEYVATHGLTIPIYTGLSAETQKAYKLGGTPQTIVVSREGRVLQDWMGAYAGDQKSQVEAFFHVNLPGLRELPKAEAAKN